MEFRHLYKGKSNIKTDTGATGIAFAPDVYREPTFFNGLLNKKIPFREAMSALHHIVVSDFRYQPKDRTAYLEWAKSQEDIWLAEAMIKNEANKALLNHKTEELKKINTEANALLGPYYKARQKYFQLLYVRDRAAWMVLDPVITVHPDSLFFECFSLDESSYGKLSCNYNVFKEVNEFKCGTTNIDYSIPLYNEFQKIRNYKDTSFNIDPSGFEVKTADDDGFKEVKIDLPDSWVRGFLQVSSAMTMNHYQFDIDPVDMRNILFFMARNKEDRGPRSIRWILKNGEQVKAVMEPWNKTIVCGKTIYQGENEGEIRMWGRRRLKLLERMLPVARKIKVSLLGTGLPSFFEADLMDMTFTLGLSGWTTNDWSRSSNFDLMIPRHETDGQTQQNVYLALKKHWFASSETLSKELGLSNTIVESAMTNFIQEGKVVYDLHGKVYRIRELTKDPLPMDKIRYRNEREQEAAHFIDAQKVQYGNYTIKEKSIIHNGIVNEGKEKQVMIEISDDEKMINATCTCRFYHQNKLMQGPCAHMLALRKVSAFLVEQKLEIK